MVEHNKLSWLLYSKSILYSFKHDQESKDPHGRTPLLLAIALGFTDSVKVLLKNGCDTTAADKEGWNGKIVFWLFFSGF